MRRGSPSKLELEHEIKLLGRDQRRMILSRHSNTEEIDESRLERLRATHRLLRRHDGVECASAGAISATAESVWTSNLAARGTKATSGANRIGALESVLPGHLNRAISRHFSLALLGPIQPPGLYGTRCVTHHDTILWPSLGEEHSAVLRSGDRRRPRIQRRRWLGQLFERRAAACRVGYAKA